MFVCFVLFFVSCCLFVSFVLFLRFQRQMVHKGDCWRNVGAVDLLSGGDEHSVRDSPKVVVCGSITGGVLRILNQSRHH